MNLFGLIFFCLLYSFKKYLPLSESAFESHSTRQVRVRVRLTPVLLLVPRWLGYTGKLPGYWQHRDHGNTPQWLVPVCREVTAKVTATVNGHPGFKFSESAGATLRVDAATTQTRHLARVQARGCRSRCSVRIKVRVWARGTRPAGPPPTPTPHRRRPLPRSESVDSAAAPRRPA